MNVKGIFKTLIIIVVCVVIGATILNLLLPNVTTQLINATEDMIFKATGMSFDFNADSNAGDSNPTNSQTGTPAVIDQPNVEGFN